MRSSRRRMAASLKAAGFVLIATTLAAEALPLASAAPVAGLTALFFGFRPLRTFTGGLAIGTAALLAQITLSGDVDFALGALGLRVFTVVNALVCLFIARMSLDAKSG